MIPINNQETKVRGEYKGLRNEVGIRIRLRQDTINITIILQTFILILAVLTHALYPENNNFGYLLLITPFVGFLFQLILLDHQVKTMVAVLYLKLSGRSGWQRFYDSFTYEHPRMRWVSSLLGILDPGVPLLPSVVSLGFYAIWYNTLSPLFWIETAVLVLIQFISLGVGLYLIKSRLPVSK